MTKVTHLTLDERGALSRKRIHLREISGDAEAPLETVGQDLRAARLRRGDDLATVSRVLKIRKDHLEALEEDRFEALPGRAYAVGFVRSYADYLGLDPLQCVERFKSEIAGRTEVQPTVAPPPDSDTVRLPQGWLMIGIVALVVVVIVAVQLVRSADTMLRQPVASVPARMAPPAPPPVTASVPKPAPVAAAPVQPTAQQVAGVAPTTNPPGAASAAPGAVPPAQTPPVVSSAQAPAGAATTPAGQAAAAAPNAQVAAIPPPLPPGHVYGSNNSNPRVVLRARVPVHILIQGPDQTVYLNRMLQPGDSYYVPNKVGLTLTTPNGSAVEVDLDGQQMGYAAQGKQMTEALSLDPQAVFDRFNRNPD